MKKILIIFVVFSFSMHSFYAQNKTVKGRIISEYFEPVADVSIIINDSIEIGKTDINGFFNIDIPTSVREVFFGTVGLETTTIKLVDECNSIDIVMMASFSYDFMKLSCIDKKRKKRYNKLPNIHKKAFEKGLFETEYMCYNREFEYLYSRH